jgi:glycine/D-amino acid oxidase-like deaminating enzyme
MYDVVIFESGISGLTLAHELVEKGFKNKLWWNGP